MQTSSVDHFMGTRLKQYQIRRLIGQGKLSAVYEAWSEEQQQAVTVTMFIAPPTMPAQARERFIGRFLREGGPLLRLRHPHILQVYDFGELSGYPYIVTPLPQGRSLTKVLKDRGRLEAEEVVQLLRQIAPALDYAHSQGVIHGNINATNILLSEQHTLLIAGFGLVNLLALRGVEEIQHPYTHLLSVAGTFLGTPGYIAPETVQNALLDARSDVYALGVILFELLTGRLPFTGANPFAVAVQHTQQPIPLLNSLVSDIPSAIDLVVRQAMERDPNKRMQSAGDVLIGFEQALNPLQGADRTTINTQQGQYVSEQVTLPPTVNWFDEEALEKHRRQQSAPSEHNTASLRAYAAGPMNAPSSEAPKDVTGKWQLLPPIVTSKMPSVSGKPETTAAPSGLYSDVTIQDGTEGEDQDAFDPFSWWSATAKSRLSTENPGTVQPVGALGGGAAASGRQPDKKRRRVVAVVAAGGAVAAIGLGFGGISLAHLLKPSSRPGTSLKSQLVATPTRGSTLTPAPTRAVATAQPTPKPTPKPSPTAAPAQSQSPSPTPRPTSPPTPTPTPPQHTGTVIGSTAQAVNSAKSFTNTADGAGSLLVHLPGGNFVAYEAACTHEGVTVYYDAGRQKLICPRHNAIFDPANGANVLQGPAPRPLPGVAVRVNADGTVTTG